ncbi:MAG: UDP-N-acetylmuramate dehydrogenase [Pyrinomonadaceae bacterium]|nr:UDP-N-acetylmuramate dehydrogenase [Pyrinomonadaceae bacterium]
MSFLIEENISLAEMTTLKIGGKAKFFAAAKSEMEVVEALKFAEENNLETFILGGGSNVLIADEGFDGLVLQIALKGIFVERAKDKILVTANAGEDWDAFCEFCVAENLPGVECLSGIPGLVGGTPVQNVGAYGQEVSETIFAVKVFDRADSQVKKLSNADCGFAYRSSIFNTSQKNRYIVLAVTFSLTRDGEPKIVYKDLRELFGGKMPTLQKTRQAVLKIRAAKSMVIDERDPNSKSAGSFFKNPIVANERFAEIEKRAKTFGIESVPHFKFNENNVKIPAAWLIENSGFHKGFRQGNAAISTKHTLAIVNLGNASARDVWRLKDEIQAKVKEIFDVELKPEPIFVGF